MRDDLRSPARWRDANSVAEPYYVVEIMAERLSENGRWGWEGQGSEASHGERVQPFR
jgi:hypothetical protein